MRQQKSTPAGEELGFGRLAAEDTSVGEKFAQAAGLERHFGVLDAVARENAQLGAARAQRIEEFEGAGLGLRLSRVVEFELGQFAVLSGCLMCRSASI